MREDTNVSDEAYSDIRFEMVEAFRYMKYAVISTEPEDDAINHVCNYKQKPNVGTISFDTKCIQGLDDSYENKWN